MAAGGGVVRQISFAAGRRNSAGSRPGPSTVLGGHVTPAFASPFRTVSYGEEPGPRIHEGITRHDGRRALAVVSPRAWTRRQSGLDTVRFRAPLHQHWARLAVDPPYPHWHRFLVRRLPTRIQVPSAMCSASHGSGGRGANPSSLLAGPPSGPLVIISPAPLGAAAEDDSSPGNSVAQGHARACSPCPRAGLSRGAARPRHKRQGGKTTLALSTGAKPERDMVSLLVRQERRAPYFTHQGPRPAWRGMTTLEPSCKDPMWSTPNLAQRPFPPTPRKQQEQPWRRQ